MLWGYQPAVHFGSSLQETGSPRRKPHVMEGKKNKRKQASSTPTPDPDSVPAPVPSQENKTAPANPIDDARLAKALLAPSPQELMQREMEKLMLKAKPNHQFWDNQPVPHCDKDFATDPQAIGAIEQVENKIAQIPRNPYPLPSGFEWFEVDIDNDAMMQSIYDLLAEHYVEDSENTFRFNYSIPFLRWALKPPGFLRQWHIGVRVASTGKPVGFISAVPTTIRTNDTQMRIVEINFLCVHKKLRSRRVAPVLIMEITRRVNLEGIFQAIYTAGVEIPTPICTARYYHRSLNPRKLIAGLHCS